MPVLDPWKKRIAQGAKFRHGRICRRCRKKFRKVKKCPRCGSKNYRDFHHDAKPKGSSK